jgi:hypothetical protein
MVNGHRCERRRPRSGGAFSIPPHSPWPHAVGGSQRLAHFIDYAPSGLGEMQTGRQVLDLPDAIGELIALQVAPAHYQRFDFGWMRR